MSYFEELLQISHLAGEPRVRYSRMLGLLRRLCLELSADFKSDYSTLFSRILAVCSHLGIDHHPADRFRLHARRVLHGSHQPSSEEERCDLADLCSFIAQALGEAIPAELPQHIRPLKVKNLEAPQAVQLRGVIVEVLTSISFTCRLEGSATIYTIEWLKVEGIVSVEENFTKYCYRGANVMLLDPQPKRHATDVLEVYMAILEPDYLLDVSALTSTIKPYGASPLNYLLGRLVPNLPNRFSLMGNMVNQFMDDCINDSRSESSYQTALRKNYRSAILDFTCIDEEEVGPDFFDQARRQYDHIRESVANRFPAVDVGIRPTDCLLEPAFICPALGLRGRLDVMTTDFRRVLELKSGKCVENQGCPVAPKEDHLLQMTLYGEILRRNFRIPWGQVQTFLFYSVYPFFIHERPSAAAIRQVLHLRNGIIRLLHELMVDGGFERILPLLTPDHLNQANLRSSFYFRYLFPSLRAQTAPLEKLAADDLLCSYFSRFLTFTLREQFMSKTSDNRPDSIRGFAATWTADLRTKLLAGNILTGLRLEATEATEAEGITTLLFRLPDYDGTFVPNFNVGEMVQVYEAADPSANVTNRQLFRATVKAISAESLTLSLAYPQRNRSLFQPETLYAIEHDATDGPSQQQLRNLYSFLLAPQSRRNLLLARRRPECDPKRHLVGSHPAAVADIILRAKQARDYFLLVGPPGTGKTNIALRAMVKEFLLTRRSDPKAPEGSLLLTAYTNRAVDEICSMLAGLSEEIPFDYLRIGQTATCDPNHRSHLLSERAANLSKRSEVLRMLMEVPIVVGTVMTLTNNQILFRRKHFSAAIIDEASQILEPQALGLLSAEVDGREAIDKFILIGDHKQLPAVVMLPDRQTEVHDSTLRKIGLFNLRHSLFERLHRLETRTGDSRFVGFLHRQGRMHREICDFVNRAFYEGSLDIVPLPHQVEPLPWKSATGPWESFVASTRMGFVDVSAEEEMENLRANGSEAEAIGQLVQAICTLCAKNGDYGFDAARHIGIIVPFRSQIAHIRATLRRMGMVAAEEMTIDTVECYQGSQRDYILFSTTISQPYQLDILSSVSEVNGSLVDRKLNVALTRARRQCFIVGNRTLLSRNTLYRNLIAACKVMDNPPRQKPKV